MFMVTAGTLHKEHFFKGGERLSLLQQSIFDVAEAYGWQLQAWAIFPNHYHFIAKAPEDAASLKTMIQRLHSQTARETNRMDKSPGRRVWFQYWDTCLTYEKSYFARLNYVHKNPVKHGILAVADQYPWCSAGWFQKEAEGAFRRKVESYHYDKVNVMDDF
jgi:putative transposase